MKKAFLIVLLALSFLACQKNNSGSEPIDPPESSDTGPITDKQLVDSVITTYSNGTYVIDYNYDAKNRLIDMHSRVTGNAYGDVADHVYTYDSQDNLIKSIIKRNQDVSIFDYSYVNNVPTAVAYSQPNNPSQGHTIDITTKNSLISYNAIHAPSGESATVDYTYTNNNKVNEVNKSFSPMGNLTFNLTLDGEYGTKKNPYLYTGNKWLIPDVPFSNKNDLLKETISNNGAISISTYTNTYNKQGYPIKVTERRTSTQGTTEINVVYKYIDAK